MSRLVHPRAVTSALAVHAGTCLALAGVWLSQLAASFVSSELPLGHPLVIAGQSLTYLDLVWGYVGIGLTWALAPRLGLAAAGAQLLGWYLNNRPDPGDAALLVTDVAYLAVTILALAAIARRSGSRLLEAPAVVAAAGHVLAAGLAALSIALEPESFDAETAIRTTSRASEFTGIAAQFSAAVAHIAGASVGFAAIRRIGRDH